MSGNTKNGNKNPDWNDFEDDSILEQLLDEPFELTNSRLRLDDKYNGFDNNSGETWIYPTNLPIRTYQFNITKTALFRNTLVVLPTGLGKTFIAAVVMYNIYRWYPMGKVVFMAPTRPLVAQQIEACCNIVGIPATDSAELTGKNSKKDRAELWRSKRVFFATPQVVQSDISDAETEFPFDKVKLLVVDEAHKARGRYAYTEVVQGIHARNPNLRILALSATPGRRVEDVAEVIRNLFISHLEVRWDNSIDVASYTHKRTVAIVVVPLGEQLSAIRDDLIAIVDPFIRNLIDNGVLSTSGNSLSKNILIMEQQRFRRNSIHERHPKQSAVSTDFSTAISLYHALELLERHGLRVFLNYFEDENEKEKFFVAMNPKLRRMIESIRREAGPNPFSVSVQTMTNGQIQRMPGNLDFGHPKFEKAKEHILKHFQNAPDSKVIVFCEYRESVMLMHRLLLQSRPAIQPRVFVGQGGTGAIRAVTQKEQMQIMDDFRKGVCNTLIATSVAEEGIDVGEVDLIICFDISTKNPTRLVQRIGRTGRKRQGNVIMLATEGKEHAIVKEVLASKDKTNQKLARSREVAAALYQQSSRIVPPEFDPKCVETFIQPREPQPIPSKEKAKPAKASKKPLAPAGSQDMRKFFKKVELDKEEKAVFSEPLERRSFVEEPIEEIVDEKDETLPDELYAQMKILRRKLERPPKLKSFAHFSEVLFSNEYSKDFKAYLLRLNFDFVKETHDAMEAVLALDNDEVVDLSAVGTEEKKVRKRYAAITDVLGDKFAILDFLEKGNERICIKEKDECDIFDGLQERGFYDDNQNFIETRLQQIPNLSAYFAKNEEIASEVYDQDDAEEEFSMLESEYNETGSKYASQIEKLDRSKRLSAPLRMENQSTPVRGGQIARRSVGVFEASPIVRNKASKVHESPLAKAFAKVKEKEENLSRFFESTFNFESPKKADGTLNDPPMDKTPKQIKEEAKALEVLNESIKKSKSFANMFESKLAKDQNDTKTDTNPPKTTTNSSSDLFDDDFDDILATSNFFADIETKFEAPAPPKAVASAECMVTVSQVLRIVDKVEEKKPERRNVSNPELEDFDVNDFLDPFDEGEIEEIPYSQNLPVAGSSSQKENISQVKSPKREARALPKTSPSVLYKKPISLRDKLFRKSLAETRSEIAPMPVARRSLSTSIANESVIRVKRKANRMIESSESESDEAVFAPKTKTKLRRVSLSDDDDFADVQSYPPSQTAHSTSRRERIHNHRKRQRQRCAFFEDEAEHSGSETEGEADVSNTVSQYLLDSIVVNDEDVEDHPSVNMQAKYLQSLRSPVRRPGAFKIPAPRIFNDHSRIFSQAVPVESNAAYKECSFVVSSEEGDDDDDNDCEVTSEISPLKESFCKFDRRQLQKAAITSKFDHFKAKRKKFARNCVASSDEE